MAGPNQKYQRVVQLETGAQYQMRFAVMSCPQLKYAIVAPADLFVAESDRSVLDERLEDVAPDGSELSAGRATDGVASVATM
jgi:hypothetical protein